MNTFLKLLVIGMALSALTGLFWGCSSAPAQEVSPLFPGKYSFDLKKMSILSDKNDSLDFNRVMCVWTVGRDNAATDEVRVTALADALVDFKPAQNVTDDPGSHDRLRVADGLFDRQIRLVFKDDEEIVFYFGKREDQVYARVGGTDTVYGVSGIDLESLSLDAGYWYATDTAPL